MLPSRITRAASIAALAAISLGSAGCVVAIGNTAGKKNEDRVRLGVHERSDAIVVRSQADVPGFGVAEIERVSLLGPETTVDEFRHVFPEAIFRDSREMDAGSQVQLYEVRDRRVYRFGTSSYGYIEDQPVYFRFIDGTLAGWNVGDPDELEKQFEITIGG
ncbi:MAG: hypothetical protein AAFX79_09550 [Planctomycetota bacterium]